MKKIIVPVDFSEKSEHALNVAVSLAKKNNAEILVLHMLELNQVMISSANGAHPEQLVFMLKHAERLLGNFLNKPHFKGVSITPVIKHYKVFSEVNEVAKQHGADLIVMGSQGSDGLAEIFVGSNTEKVVRNADVPVLVIKDKLDDFKINRFVFACDLREDSLGAFQKARNFAKMLEVDIDLVYINTPGDNFMSSANTNIAISKFLDQANVEMEVQVYNDHTIDQGIVNYCNATSADLIGISTHGRKGLSHFFLGSIGEDVVNHSKIPVVTFKM